MWFEIHEEKPIYRQLTEYFEQRILDKRLQPDEALPSVRTIATDLSVNPQTVLKALQDLLQRKIIYKKRGLGMYVAPDAREILLSEKKGVYLRQELVQCLKQGLAMDIKKEELLKIIQDILQKGI